MHIAIARVADAGLLSPELAACIRRTASSNRGDRGRCSTNSWWRKATISNWSAARERIQHERLWRSERSVAFIATRRIGGRPKDYRPK